ncbi:hypothetical protein V2J09_019584 [Rumex salicifolius]
MDLFDMRKGMNAQTAADKAVAAIGCGYDLTSDLRLSSCKSKSSGAGRSLIDMDHSVTRDLVLPGGIVVPGVSASIKCDKGERTRFCSDVLTFNQMSELFNQEMSLSGKIPCGHFNTMFNLKACWQKDAAITKALALDGWWISLYTVELAKSQVKLSEEVKREVPSSWDPAALAEFIEKYGTHVIVGVKMGGKDVIHVKQLHGSNLPPTELQMLLKKLADERFSQEGNSGRHSAASSTQKQKDKRGTDWELRLALASSFRPNVSSHSKSNDVLSIRVRRGGVDLGDHKQWLSTISESPTVITMSFVPITSLLYGVQGCGFLSHAVNLYLRYKPPIEELTEFLEFQLPRQWAPQFSDLPLGLHRKRGMSPKLQFSFMGPKLSVNNEQVDTGNLPVTGMRLFLEGKRSNHLAIHLQHLSAIPKILFHLSSDADYHPNYKTNHDSPRAKEYYEPLKLSIFSHVCTAPVEHHGTTMEETASIVTKARLEVKHVGIKKVLFLRLGFSTVASARIRRSEWDEPSSTSKKSGMFSNLISGRFSTGLMPQPEEAQKPDINSALFPGGPPVPAKAPKLAAIVDMKEMVRGPEDQPGYWVVTGAKLCVENGKVSIRVKYSLLTVLSEDSMLLDDEQV